MTHDVHDRGLPGGNTVLASVDDTGIAWVYFNRPEKRNAMNPALNIEMYEVLDALEGDDRVKVVVLTGAGTAWSAGMDLKEYAVGIRSYRAPVWVCNRLMTGRPVLIFALPAREPGGRLWGRTRPVGTCACW